MNSVREAEKRYPSAPRFLYGHSLGGLLSLSYGLSHKLNVRGMIVSSPGLRTAIHEQKMKLMLAKVLGTHCTDHHPAERTGCRAHQPRPAGGDHLRQRPAGA